MQEITELITEEQFREHGKVQINLKYLDENGKETLDFKYPLDDEIHVSIKGDETRILSCDVKGGVSSPVYFDIPDGVKFINSYIKNKRIPMKNKFDLDNELVAIPTVYWIGDMI